MTMTVETHQSKWGYHPISREASKKLRFINGVFAKKLHLDAAWKRWSRKDPQNRVVKRTLRNELGQKIGRELVKDSVGNPVYQSEPKLCTIFAKMKVDGWRILEASRQARIPQPSPEDVKPFPFTEEQIDQFYEIACEWISKK